MRMLLRVSIPVETGNAAVKAGTLGSTIRSILEALKPEAAYFLADDDGNRSGSIVFDMTDSSQIPAIAEPWLLAFNAKISFRPVMNHARSRRLELLGWPRPQRNTASKLPWPTPARSYRQSRGLSSHTPDSDRVRAP